MTARKFAAFLLAASMLVAFAACDDDDDDDNPVTPDDGFVAENADFDNYTGWDRVEFVTGPVNSTELQGFAHGGSDSSVVRDVYASDAGAFSNGEWAQGTIMMKETHGFTGTTPTSPTRLAMVKRGGDFDAEANGWEFFMFDGNGDIANRSGDNRDDFAGCIACHGDAPNDWIFEHPSSYELSFADGAEALDWIEATDWELLETRTGEDPALQGFAHGGGADDTYREIYRWQPAGVYKDGIFPTGTVIAKRAYMDDGSGETLLAWTVMVKKDLNDWQWLMIDGDGNLAVDTDTQNTNAGCTSCHAGATGSAGGDWVFLHPGLGNG